MLAVQDELWCYYSGLPVENCWAGSEKEYGRPIINTGLARWPLERILYAGLKRGFSKAYMTLAPFALREEADIRVLVNADCANPHEDIKVSLLDADSNLTIPGFGFDDFVINKTDGGVLGGAWQSAKRMKSGVEVIPCFALTGKTTKLYSSEFVF